MTPEKKQELIKRFYECHYDQNKYSCNIDSLIGIFIDGCAIGFEEATRQAYLDAARICERQEQEDCEGERNIYRECAKAIRAKAKEYDNE